MKRDVSLEEISDGRLYGSGDMVRTDTGGCEGCSSCCRGMGSSAVLDPMDVWRLCGALSCGFDGLLEKYLELKVTDGWVLPNLKMTGKDEACGFLNEQGRCTVHDARPGVCRLFPLGRYYSGRDFQYFVQIHECPAPKTMVKVKKWLQIPQLPRYEAYIRDWHFFLEDAAAALEGMGDAMHTKACTFVLETFYARPWDETDFYEQFAGRLREGARFMGIAAPGGEESR